MKLFFISFIFSVVLTSSILLSVRYLSVKNNIGAYLKATQDKTEVIAGSIAKAFNGGDTSTINTYTWIYPRMLLIDAYGTVQADSMHVLTGTHYENAADGIYNASDNDTFDPWCFPTEKSITCVTTAEINYNLKSIGSCVIIADAIDLAETIRRFDWYLLYGLGAAIILSIIVSLLIARINRKPLKQLISTLDKATAGDYTDTAIDIKGDLKPVSDRFNTLIAQIQQLDKARIDFVSDASHELKTPLATIKVLLQTVMYSDMPKEDMYDFLKSADSEIDRASKLVSDMLILSINSHEKKHLNFIETNAADIVSDIIKRLSPVARENGIDLRFMSDSRENLTFHADPDRLSESIYNLVDNAIKYTKRSGTVNASVTRSGKNIVIKVSDNGIGISEEHLCHIFERFYRVDKARSRASGGTGLGLAIAKEIITQHSGEIVCESTLGKGTVFTVTVPIKQNPNAGDVL